MKKLAPILENEYNYQRTSDEILYNGINGTQLKVNIFMGPTYYQRLTCKYLINFMLEALVLILLCLINRSVVVLLAED